MARNTSTAHVVITMDGKQAVDMMKGLQRQVQQTRNELDQMQQMGIGPDDPQYKKKLDELKAMQKAVNQNRTAYINLQDIVDNLNKTTLAQLQRALKECRKQMNNLTADDPRMKDLIRQYQQIDNQIGKITGQWKRQDGAILSVIKRLVAYVSVYSGWNVITGQLQNIAQRNLEFSDSLADIQKTTGLSAKGVAELSGEISKIDTRTSVEELHKLAYEAGKLGIGSEGVEGVAGFVRAADKISVALGEELGGSEAIKELMKMNDVLGLTQKMGIEKSLMATGSAINLLGQSTTANADYIADFTRRLAGIGAQAHISIADLMAFGAAADSTGQELEVAATAMNLFITQLQTHYKTVSQAAGVDENLIKSLLEVGKTTEAVMLVLRGLSEKGGLSQLGPLMKDLGSEGARMSGVLANFASNLDMIDQALMISNKGFEEAISVTNEYMIKNENAAAIMEKVANSWDKVFINVKNTQELKEVAQEFYDLSQSVQNNTLLMTELKIVLALVVEVIKQLVSMLPSLIMFFSIKGLVQFSLYVKTLAVDLYTMSKNAIAAARGVTSAGAAATATGTAFSRLTLILRSNVFLFVASAIAALIMRLSQAKKELSDVEKSANDLSDSFRKFSKDSNAAGIEANTLFGRLKNLKAGTDERRDLLIKINELYGKYIPHLLSEKSTLEEIKEAQDAVNASLAQSIAYRSKESAIQRVGEQYTSKLADQISDLQNVYSAAGVGNLGDIDAQKLAELTAKYYDAGLKWRSAQKQIWQDMYGPKGMSHSLVTENSVFINRMDEAQRAVNNYVAHFYNQQQAIKNINKKYDPVIGSYKPKEEEEGPYKITEAEKDAEAKRRQREQLKFAQDERDAVMAAIKVYYSQQRQVINDSYLQQKITTEQREKELTDIELRELNTRIEARKKLHGDADENWATELGYISQNDIAKTDSSQKAIVNLTSKNLDDIREKLKKFGTGEMDGIWSELEKDLLKIQEISIDLQKEIEDILLKKDYSGQVERNYQAQLEKLGLFFTQYEEMAKEGMEGASGEMLLGLKKLANQAAGEGMKALLDISKQLYTIDINTEEGQAAFRKMLSDQAIFGEEMVNLEEDRLKALYYKTIEYGDATTQAIKKQREEQLKIAAERFAPRHRELDKEGKGYEWAVNFRKAEQDIGLATPGMVLDTEVEMYRQRLEAAQEYYDYLATHGYDVEEQRMVVEQAASDLSEKMVEQVKNRLSTYKDYFDAFEEMGENFTFEGGEEGLEARQEAFENFVKEMGNLTKELIMNWVKEKIEHALIRAAMVDTEKESQDEMSDVSKEGLESEGDIAKKAGKKTLSEIAKIGLSKISLKKKENKDVSNVVQEGQNAQQTLVESGEGAIADTMVQIGQQVVSAKKTQAAENVSTSASETAAEVPLGIASGAAKTIGNLGWWGIPLVAVISAVLGALLNTAMSAVSNLFGGSEKTTPATTATKLVTGMLTYDSGNVQSVASGSSTVNVAADDGHTYNAHVAPALPAGVGVVNSPLATLVNGKPSIVGERGPEIVIGRETTRAIMQYRPDLLQGLISYDKHFSNGGGRYRAYDNGNVQLLSPSMTGSNIGVTNEELAGLLRDVTSAISQNAEVNQALTKRMGNIRAQIVRKEMVDETVDELYFRRERGSDKKINKMFGKK
nr:MAG TPA: tail tape measure protein [Caudoviricetes sp.]